MIFILNFKTIIQVVYVGQANFTSNL